MRGPGADRFFYHQDDGSFQPLPGDFGALSHDGNAYQLSEKNGTSWQFDSDGRLAYVEDTNHNRVTLQYTDGRLTTLTHGNGEELTIGYNGEGFIDTVTDPKGPDAGDDRVTQYNYTGSGEYLSTVTTADERVTEYAYQTSGDLTELHTLLSAEYPDGRGLYFEYDDAGRLVKTHGKDGVNPVSYHYDSVGEVRVVNALGVETVMRRGLNGQWSQVSNPGGQSTLRMTYNDAGLPTDVAGPQGELYRYSYDAQGNVTAVTDPMRGETGFSYEPDVNQLGMVTDARGNAIDYDHDDSGNLTKITYEDGTHESFTHDDNGNVKTWTNRRGQTVSYAYNVAGQLTSKDYDTTPGYVDYEYGYDTAGNLVSAGYTTDEGTSTTEYTYDADTQWLTRIDYPGGQWFEFEYDDVGRRTKRTDQLGHIENYTYDHAGRLDVMTDESDELIVDYDFDAAGRMSKKTLGNGVYTTYDYDAAGRLIDLGNYKPDDSLLSRFQYTYDASGRVTSKVSTYPPGDERTSGTESYGYDELGQLTRVEYPDGRVVEYVYDAVGNRVQVIEDGVAAPYTTNNMNQYSEVGDATYEYDDDGNLINKTEDGVTTTYTYNAENRLVKVEQGPTGETPTDTWEYVYDGGGKCVKSVHNGSASQYVRAPAGSGVVAAEYNDAGLAARHTQGYGVVSRSSDTAKAFYTFDGLGSTVELVAVDAEVLNRYKYDSFGNTLSEQISVTNPYQFAGQLGAAKMPDGSYSVVRTTATSPAAYSPTSGSYITPSAKLQLMGRSGYTPRGDIVQLGVGVFHVGTGLVGLGAAGVFTVSAIAAAPTPLGFLSVPLGTLGVISIGSGWLGLRTGMLEIIGGLGFSDYEGGAPTGLFDAYCHSRGHTDPASRAICQKFDAVVGILSVLAGRANLKGVTSQSTLAGSEDCYVRLIHRLEELGDAETLYEAIRTLLPDLSGIRRHVQIASSWDPNDKLTIGFGDEGFIQQDTGLPYTIRFENMAKATAPAQKIVITDTLDENLNLETFELNEIAFADQVIVIPKGLDYYETSVPLTVEGAEGPADIMVEIEVGVNREARELAAEFLAIDPETGWLPEDIMTGLLYPNDDTGRGEGHVSYLVEPQPALPSGTRIENEATIVFDWNEPIETPLVVNTIDADAPQSEVKSLPATAPGPEFPVSWAGDDGNGSGIAEYDIYVSTDGGPFELWLDGTSETSATFSGEMEHTYSFYSVALDNVRHRESAPTTPDAETTVPDQVPPSVVQVLVRGDSWEGSFESYLDSQGLGNEDGYAIPVGSDAQLDTLPWSGINEVSVMFSEQVSVTADDIDLYGVDREEYTSNFSYVAATHTVTLTLDAGIAGDKLLLMVNDTVNDADGNALDGEWEDGISTVSGDATGGGDFEFLFNVLPGDVTNSGNVVAGDVSVLASAFGSFARGSSEAYSPFVDFDGSGNVVAGDVSILASHFGQFLPSGEPTLPANSVTIMAAVEAKTTGATDDKENAVTVVSAAAPDAMRTATAAALPTASAASTGATGDHDLGRNKPLERSTHERFSGLAADVGASSQPTGARAAKSGITAVQYSANGREATRYQLESEPEKSSNLAPQTTSLAHSATGYLTPVLINPSAQERSTRVPTDQTVYEGSAASGQPVTGMGTREWLSQPESRSAGKRGLFARSVALEAVSLELRADRRAEPLLQLGLDARLVDDLRSYQDDSDRWSEAVDLALTMDDGD